MPWVWGEGSVVWLTRTGLRGVDLGAVRDVNTPPSPTTVAHGVLVAWSMASFGTDFDLQQFKAA